MSSNPYYDSSGWPPPKAKGSTASFRTEFDAIETGFLKIALPTINTIPVGDGTKLVAKTASQLKAIMAFTSADVGLGNCQNTSDINKPVSTDQAAAIALKADITAMNLKADATLVAAHTGNVANPHATTKAHVGLGNCDNFSAASMPVSILQAAAIALKADNTHTLNVANPHATTKAHVGLGNCDNFSAASMPVSILQAAAIALKLDADKLIAPGTAPMYVARAWATWDGTGTVTAPIASGNIASIDDLGVGWYRLNFIIDMPDVNYAVLPSCIDGPNDARYLNKTVSSVEVRVKNTANNVATDVTNISCVIMR